MIIKTKLLTLLLAISTTTIISLKTSAQTPEGAGTKPPPTTVIGKHQDEKHIVHDIRNERKEKALRRHEVKNGNAKGAVKSTRQIRRDKRNERRNAKALRAGGVKHPYRRAEHRIRTH